MTSEASSAPSSSSDPVTVSPPFSVKPTRTNTGIDGGAAFTQSRWGNAKGRFYIHVPTTFPCDSLWHKPPITSGHEALRQYSITPEREQGEPDSLKISLPIPAQDSLNSLICEWEHNKASQSGPEFAVNFATYAARDCVDAPSLLTVAVPCAHSMVEVLRAVRVSQMPREADECAADDMLEAEDLETTPLSTAQLKVFYPKALNDLDEVHCAIFGTFEPDETEPGLRFVADKHSDPHQFSNIGAEITGSGVIDFIPAFDDWLRVAIANAMAKATE